MPVPHGVRVCHGAGAEERGKSPSSMAKHETPVRLEIVTPLIVSFGHAGSLFQSVGR